MQDTFNGILTCENEIVVGVFIVEILILNLNKVNEADEKVCTAFANIQQQFYENSHSFVICGLQEMVEKKLDELELLELMNVTPTESEAWDIVQMEEIERELLGDE